ncbi:MAG TPA: hypothetical protein VH575_21000 [Gemmataceae bacterium]|jgi:hypothetical protein
MSSALAMVLMAAMTVPEKVSGETTDSLHLDGEWFVTPFARRSARFRLIHSSSGMFFDAGIRG